MSGSDHTVVEMDVMFPNNDNGLPKKPFYDVGQMEIYEKHYAKLLDYAKEDDISNFEETLMDPKSIKIIQGNFISARNENYTLLEKIITDDCKYNEEIFNLLMDIPGIDINFQNPFKDNKTILHQLTEDESSEDLHVLLKLNHSVDVNIQDDFGNTSLHIAAENNCVEIINELLSQEKIDTNKTNNENKTALHIALEEGNKYGTWALIDHANYKIDQKIEEIMSQSPLASFRTVIDAFQLLSLNEINKFKDMISEKMINVDDDNGGYTFLQYASMKGLHEVVQLLIEHGARLNLVADESQFDNPPFMLAGKGGYHKILEIFINRDKELAKLSSGQENRLMYKYNGDSILHIVLMGSDIFSTVTRLSDVEDDGTNPDCDREKCVQLLLKNNHYDEEPKFDINEFSLYSQTPLEIAIEYNRQEEIIHLLLKNGAYIGHDDILPRIDPNILERFLDDSVHENSYFKKSSSTHGTNKAGANENDNPDGNKRGKKTNSFKITEVCYDYQFLCPPEPTPESIQWREYEKKLQETHALVEMSRIHELRYLLKHPILSSFVTLKWNLIRFFFWIDMIFYSLFCIFFTCHILHALNEYGTEPDETAAIETPIPYYNYLIYALDFVSYLLLFLIFVREVLQIYFSPKSFLKNYENYLEMAIIVIGATYKYVILPHNLFPIHFSALIILLCWAELILLISKHPYFATELEMLKVIAKNSLKFFVWYLILNCGFGLSFNILFHYNSKYNQSMKIASTDLLTNGSTEQVNFTTPSPTTESKDKFQTWSNSIFKTFTMSLGEFTGDELNFDTNPVISYIYFFMFIFLVAILCFNLFIGVAVSDTEKIKNDARVLEMISRVQNIHFLEKIAEESGIFRGFIRFMNCVFNAFYSDVNLFPNIMKHKKIVVDWENNVNSVSFSNRNLKLSSFAGEIRHWCMPSFVVDESLSIIRQRKQELSEVTLDEIRAEILSGNATMNQIYQNINKRLEILENGENGN